jgi:hypothetical protein
MNAINNKLKIYLVSGIFYDWPNQFKRPLGKIDDEFVLLTKQS